MNSDYPYSNDYPYESNVRPEASLSRRDLLKTGTAAALAGSATVLGSGAALAQTANPAPAVITQWRPQTAGTKFRAVVRRATTIGLEELTLNPIETRQVVIRVEAAQACYTIANTLNTQNAVQNAAVPGHGAVGIVEEVGPMVRRVQRGDRVVVVVTGQCGQCFQCLRGKAANCQAGFNRPAVVVGTAADGTPVNGNLGGFAELMVAWEEMVIPLFTKHDAAELSMLSDVAMCGLGMTMVRQPVDAGSTVAVFGAGPIGLSAVQGSRLQGASQIISIDPIRYRRELAKRVGATDVLDPNDFATSAALIARIQEMTNWATDRPFAGGRNPVGNGPDFVIEAVGGERFVPRVERYSREPHGIEVLQTVYTLCPPGGVIRTCGGNYPQGSMVTFTTTQWANSSKNHAPGNLAGVQMMRDLPRWVRMFESGQFDGAALVGVKAPLARWRDAMEASAYRTAITGVVMPQA